MANKNIQATKVVIPCRISFANIWEPRSVNGSEEKYSVSCLIPKSDKTTLKKIENAIEEAKKVGVAKWGGKMPKSLKLPLRDGDLERDEECYENSMFLNAKTDRKPGIVDANLDEIISRDEFYSGCYGRASINFFPYDVNGSKGIAVGLQNLQKLEDGERLGGSSATAAEDFGDDDDDLS